MLEMGTVDESNTFPPQETLFPPTKGCWHLFFFPSKISQVLPPSQPAGTFHCFIPTKSDPLCNGSSDLKEVPSVDSWTINHYQWVDTVNDEHWR